MVEIKENSDKDVKIYPYFCDIEIPTKKVEDFPEVFKIENAEENVVEYISDTYLVLVVDDVRNGIMCGRFFKLRDDSPSIFNRVEGVERDIELLSEENVKEESHFVWHINDKIMFAEYNFKAIRMFSSPLSYYLNEKFGVEDCKITPIEDKHTFTHLKKEEEILSLNLKLTQDSTKTLEEEYNLPAWKGLLEIGKDNETIFEVSVKRCRKKDSQLNKEKVISFVSKLVENKAPIESVKVEAQDIVYDLIKNNLLFYFVKVNKDGRNLDKEKFYTRAISLYNKHINSIKENLKKD